MISNISRTIFFVPRKMPFAPAFKSSDPEKKDTVEFSTKNLGLGVNDEEKIKILDGILTKKLNNYKACIKYYKGECEDIKSKVQKDLEKVMSDDGVSYEFLEKALKAVKRAKTFEGARFVADEATKKNNNIIKKYWGSKLLERKIDSGTNIARKAIIDIGSNIKIVENQYKQALCLDDVPERLKVGRKKVSMIEKYFEQVNEQHKGIKQLRFMPVDIMDIYNIKLNNLKQKFGEYWELSPQYLGEIDKELSKFTN
ncbi:MAG: hypothetical protein KHX03_09180 [Clostridium sp.]|nr:hypothetical protein [Clostridium sp.]